MHVWPCDSNDQMFARVFSFLSETSSDRKIEVNFTHQTAEALSEKPRLSCVLVFFQNLYSTGSGSFRTERTKTKEPKFARIVSRIVTGKVARISFNLR